MSNQGISRRSFIQGAAASTALLSTASVSNVLHKDESGKSKTPLHDGKNIIIITCDQLAWDAIGANGNKDVTSPGINKIIESGVSFDKSYCQFPLCSPSRASFWTGKLPHQTGVYANNSLMIHNRVPTIGSIFSESGYDTQHFGKTHDFGSLRGFNVARENLGIKAKPSPAYPEHYQSERDRVTVKEVEKYLDEEHPNPFLLAVEFYNPHNINNWIGAFQGPHGDIDGMNKLPKLRDNYDNPDLANRPNAIKYACCTTFRQGQTAGWNDKNFQQYLNAYYHYTNMADDCVSSVLKALEKSDAAENTLIVFMSDHGDALGSHKLVAKSHHFYDETTRVPFVMSGPGLPSGKRVNNVTGLCDLLPTLCEYANIAAPNNLYGQSILSLAKGNNNTSPRETTVSHWHSLSGASVQPARMLRNDRYKYTIFLEDHGEELYDMTKDPGEKLNLVNSSEHIDVLEEMRRLFKEYLDETKDPFYTLAASPGENKRNHTLGYHNHVGSSGTQF